MLQTLFGRSRARRMFYTGWRVPAEELYRTGVVECCVPLEQLMPEAMKLYGWQKLVAEYAKHLGLEGPNWQKS